MATQADLDSTARLLELVRGGDAEATDRLLRRLRPALSQWVRGRLPSGSRGLVDSEDLVQMTMMRAVERFAEFEPRGEGALLAYLRQILMNSIREEIRRSARRPRGATVASSVPDQASTPLESTVGRDTLERYEVALGALSDEQQQAVALRIELGYPYAQIAEALGKPTAEAARKLVARALVRLAEMMYG